MKQDYWVVLLVKNLTPKWLRAATPGEEVYLMIPRSFSALLLWGMFYGQRDAATDRAHFVRHKKSNCLFYALARWLGSGKPERYLMIRRSRVRWGILHVLYGVTNADVGGIDMWSYSPGRNHIKPGFRPFFSGHVIKGDAP